VGAGVFVLNYRPCWRDEGVWAENSLFSSRDATRTPRNFAADLRVNLLKVLSFKVNGVPSTAYLHLSPG